jgi:phage/plasmid primase-like uncharacterized protein
MQGVPCPVCGGEDRFSWTDKDASRTAGTGGFYCRGGGDEHFGDGINLAQELLIDRTGEMVSMTEAALHVIKYFDSNYESVEALEKAKAKTKAKAPKPATAGAFKGSKVSAYLSEARKDRSDLTTHGYIVDKGIEHLSYWWHPDMGTCLVTADAGIYGNKRCLAVPYVDLTDSTLCGVEFITHEGQKGTLGRKGVHVLPHFGSTAKRTLPTAYVVVEGWATGVVTRFLLETAGVDDVAVAVSGGCGMSEKTAEAVSAWAGVPAYVIYEDDGKGTPRDCLSFPVTDAGNDPADWLYDDAACAEFLSQFDNAIAPERAATIRHNIREAFDTRFDAEVA